MRLNPRVRNSKFGLGATSLVKLIMLVDIVQEKKSQRNEEILKRQEEEKFRKILNERLMPFTSGNGFMRDFYTGRF